MSRKARVNPAAAGNQSCPRRSNELSCFITMIQTMLKTMPDDFGVEVTGVKLLAEFMGRVGGLKRVPASFAEIFLPVIKDTSSN